MEVKLKNKMLTAADNKISIVILDRDTKHADDEQLRQYTLHGQTTAEALSRAKLLNIINGGE